jgi:hypothetical protein
MKGLGLRRNAFRVGMAAAAATVLAACGGSAVPGTEARDLFRFASSGDGIDKIQHDVIIIQENRSAAVPIASPFTRGKSRQERAMIVLLSSILDLSSHCL